VYEVVLQLVNIHRRIALSLVQHRDNKGQSKVSSKDEGKDYDKHPAPVPISDEQQFEFVVIVCCVAAHTW
jgi:hypothetical protein